MAGVLHNRKQNLYCNCAKVKSMIIYSTMLCLWPQYMMFYFKILNCSYNFREKEFARCLTFMRLKYVSIWTRTAWTGPPCWTAHEIVDRLLPCDCKKLRIFWTKFIKFSQWKTGEPVHAVIRKYWTSNYYVLRKTVGNKIKRTIF